MVEITLAQKELSQMLSIAARICKNTTTIPIATCLKLSFGSGGFSVSSFDFENWVTISTPDFVNKGACEAVVPGATLSSLVSGIDKSEDITLAFGKMRLVVSAGRSKYTFGSLDPQDWPENKPCKDEAVFSVPSSRLSESFSALYPAISQEQSRHYLNGIFLQIIDGATLRLWSTDGHRASLANIPLAEKAEFPEGIILPRDMVGILSDVFSKTGETPVTIAVSKQQAKFTILLGDKKLFLSGKLIDGTYPDMRRVAPFNEQFDRVLLPSEKLGSALKRLDLLADQRKDAKSNLGRHAAFDFTPNKLVLRTRCDKGEALEDFETDSSFSSQKNFSIALFSSCIGSIKSENVSLFIPRESKSAIPIFIGPESVDTASIDVPFLSLLMPVR